MVRPPPRSTRTDTLFPYPTLFRSALQDAAGCHGLSKDPAAQLPHRRPVGDISAAESPQARQRGGMPPSASARWDALAGLHHAPDADQGDHRHQDIAMGVAQPEAVMQGGKA